MKVSEVRESWQQALVFEIRQKTFVEGQKIPLQAEFDEIYCKKYHYLLLHEKDQGIGTARINLDSKEYGKIERVAILPSYQSKGYGQKLIESCETWIAKRGLSKIVIVSQKQAVGFYEKLGYIADESMTRPSEIPTIYTEKYL